MASMLNWRFLLALLLLIVNDGYLKYEFPGLVTGKISDFAGLYVVSILIFGLIPRQKIISGVVLAVCFVFWKSPWSQPLINAVNSVISVQLGRVIDYSDLVALVVIPVAARYSALRSKQFDFLLLRRIAVIPIVALTVGAITATSVMMPTDEYSLRNADTDEPLTTAEMLFAITNVSRTFGLTCESCNPDEPHGRFAGEDFSFFYWLEPDKNGVRFVVDGHKMKGWLLPKPDYKVIDEFRDALKAEFSTLGASIEYVEAL